MHNGFQFNIIHWNFTKVVLCIALLMSKTPWKFQSVIYYSFGEITHLSMKKCRHWGKWAQKVLVHMKDLLLPAMSQWSPSWSFWVVCAFPWMLLRFYDEASKVVRSVCEQSPKWPTARKVASSTVGVLACISLVVHFQITALMASFWFWMLPWRHLERKFFSLSASNVG